MSRIRRFEVERRTLRVKRFESARPEAVALFVVVDAERR